MFVSKRTVCEAFMECSQLLEVLGTMCATRSENWLLSTRHLGQLAT